MSRDGTSQKGAHAATGNGIILLIAPAAAGLGWVLNNLAFTTVWGNPAVSSSWKRWSERASSAIFIAEQTLQVRDDE
jgi:hypothetical protein